MKTLVCFSIAMLLGGACHGQTKIYPMRPAESDATARDRVYHPEPMLFVHGINANDEGWGEVVFGSLLDAMNKCRDNLFLRPVFMETG
jgi:hypothetical protein